MNRLAGMIFIAATSLSGAAWGNEISDIAGDWRTVKHGAMVKVSDCGDLSPCGFLVSVPNEATGGFDRDVRNPDPDLKGRSLEGLPIFWGYSRSETGWSSGQLYNPDTGQTFRSSLELVSDSELRVRGCMGPFCRSQLWTRVTADDAAPDQEQPDE